MPCCAVGWMGMEMGVPQLLPPFSGHRGCSCLVLPELAVGVLAGTHKQGSGLWQ